MILLRLPE